MINARAPRSQIVVSALPVLVLALLVSSAGCGGSAGETASGPGPGGAATRVRLSHPAAVALDTRGNLYVSELEGARVVMVPPDGRLRVVAGTGRDGYAGDGRRATKASLSQPSGLAVATDGTLVIADSGNDVLRKVDRSGRITTFLKSPKLSDPIGLAFLGDDLYVADAGDVSVLRVQPSGTFDAVVKGVHAAYLAFDKAGNLDLSDFGKNLVTQIAGEDIHANRKGVAATVAGTGSAGFGGDGGPAPEAQLNTPLGLAIDSHGNVYVADSSNNRVRRIDRDGIITTVAGTSRRGYGGDGGPATAAQLDKPGGLAVDASENLYIADQGNDRVRRVDTNGVITTVAGNGK
jgi:trimeric autotransporter adhesin